MVHTSRCEHAKSKIKMCKCSCGGKLHNPQNETKPQTGLAPYEQVLTESDGGEIADFIKRVKGKEFECSVNCQQRFPITEILGYHPHDGGLANAQGEKYWVYVKCPKCGYDWSFWKVEHRLSRGV